jgi:hypothetical protein
MEFPIAGLAGRQGAKDPAAADAGGTPRTPEGDTARGVRPPLPLCYPGF